MDMAPPTQMGQMFLSKRATEFMEPPRTAGIPPPGWTDAPTLHSHGRLGEEYAGRWKGPPCHSFLVAP